MTKTHADIWRDHGQSIERADRALAESAVHDIYDHNKLEHVKEFIWVESPYQALKLAKMMNLIEEKNGWGKPLKDKFFEMYSDVVKNFTYRENTVLTQVKERLSKELDRPVEKSFYCQFDWGSFMQVDALTINPKSSTTPYGRNKVKNKEYSPSTNVGMRGFVNLAKSCGWFIPYEKIAILSERPIRYSLNERGELNNEEKKAIEWSDGSGIYVLEGIVLEDWIMEHPEKITVNKMGISKYLDECKAKVIDMDSIYVFKAGDERTMPRALMVDDEGNKYLVGTDGSTERVYYMQVNREAKTCAEAHSFIAGFDENLIVANS